MRLRKDARGSFELDAARVSFELDGRRVRPFFGSFKDLPAGLYMHVCLSYVLLFTWMLIRFR